MTFKRHLDAKFIQYLNSLREEKASWWSVLVEDKDVFIAVRQNALNAYASGASIARIEWDGSELRLKVHTKFLVFPDPACTDGPYVNLRTGAPNIKAIIVTDEEAYASHLTHIKAAARRLTGEERKGTNTIAARTDCVVDIEAAYADAAETDDIEEEDPSSGRIDIVALRDDGVIVLTEAKLYSNSEIRSRDVPMVCNQLIDYHSWAQANKRDIIDAYCAVHEYRGELHLDLVPRGGGGAPRDLDPVPRLLVFGFDRAHSASLRDMTASIVNGVNGDIPGFDGKKIQAVGGVSNVTESHLG